MTADLEPRLADAVAYVRSQTALQPEVAVILGSGLGVLADEIEDAARIPYAAIPHFPVSTVAGHAGMLVLGRLAGRRVVAMQGRVHLYEGRTPQELAFPIRVMHALGAEVLLVTNAAGGLNPAYPAGALMLIRDHIFLPGMAGQNPLIGSNDERVGPRFPPMAAAYDRDLRRIAKETAERLHIPLHEGVYVMVTGPSFETEAELAMLRAWGADAVGMSTAPDVVVARHAGMRVLGISCITNTATPETAEHINHAEVLATAEAALPQFLALMRGIIAALPQ
ncbi:MAG TPA: purine-nucleoside phosphorylase [Ktedonobacterales bacterium]|nr:purine-nucleoside phosphorylase [Ktedonobacterales bacterium]